MVKRKVVIIFFVAIMFYRTNIYAQEKRIPYYHPEKKYTSYEDCIKNFNIEDMNFILLEEPDAHLLLDYVQCRAAVRSDVYECNKLSFNDKISHCRDVFRNSQFYLELLNATQPNDRLVDMCPKYLGVESREERSQFIKAFIEGNIGFCKNLVNKENQSRCQAMIELNPSLASDESTRDSIYYLKAMKAKDAKVCKNIKNNGFRIRCQASIMNDEMMCQQDEGFKRFQEGYCREASRR